MQDHEQHREHVESEDQDRDHVLHRHENMQVAKDHAERAKNVGRGEEGQAAEGESGAGDDDHLGGEHQTEVDDKHEEPVESRDLDHERDEANEDRAEHSAGRHMGRNSTRRAR